MAAHVREEQHVKELPEDSRELCERSLTARQRSYSPYSEFRVGAALRTTGGVIITGCNVENASYGLAICAERTACVKAVSEGFMDFAEIAICADLETEFCGPCGACRQFLCEFNPDLRILLIRPRDRMVRCTNLNFLLPDSFTPKRTRLEFCNENIARDQGPSSKQ